MLNEQQFGPINIGFHPDSLGSEVASHRVSAINTRGREIGYMEWHPTRGEIEHINVDSRYRRKGIATNMWNVAHDAAATHGIANPEHSEIRSDLGDEWAHSVGG